MSLDLAPIADYYAAKLASHGTTARGVDWNGENGQSLRLRTLLKVFEHAGPGSINDLGCGYGALIPVLDSIGASIPYAGYDLSSEMVQEARKLYGGRAQTSFEVSDRPIREADYGVASGIFNIRLGISDERWWEAICSALDSLHATSKLGFAFNCLTSYSDEDRMRSDLYYANPCRLFDHCKRRYSASVALLHDYGLYEFTVIVRQGRITA